MHASLELRIPTRLHNEACPQDHFAGFRAVKRCSQHHLAHASHCSAHNLFSDHNQARDAASRFIIGVTPVGSWPAQRASWLACPQEVLCQQH